MKLLLSPLALFTCLIMASIGSLRAQTGTWAIVATYAPHTNEGVMLLLTDGTIICHNNTGGTYGTGWDRLTPDSTGSYVNGTWTSIASMNDDRLYFSSQVLPSGKVYVAGGEYGDGENKGEVYDPVSNTWTVCGPVSTEWSVLDSPSELLYDGRVLEGAFANRDTIDCLFYTPSTNLFTPAANSLYYYEEVAWLKLPDSSVLFIGDVSENSNRYIPQTNTWINDDTVPGNIHDPYGGESGTAYMLPNGKAIFFGATPYNAIYTPSGNQNPGTWSSADSFPIIQGSYVGQPDASGAMMVNGHILLAVSPVGTSPSDEYRFPLYFVEYDYTTNTFTQVTSNLPPIYSDSLPSITSYETNMLVLPDGNVLFSCYTSQYWVYSPGSAPIPQGKPTINSILPDGCPLYKITGKLFNGISEGASYGDDWQMATNYPLVRLTNGTNVYYAKTTNWNRIGAVQTDSLEDTAVFETPANLPAGTYSVYVVANGFASNPVLFNVLQVSSASADAGSGKCNGSAWLTADGGIAPYTYSWTTGGQTTDTITNQCAGSYCGTVTDANGCTSSACVNIVTGIENIEPGTGQIAVYPNPNNGIFTIQSSVLSGQCSVEIYNELGQEVKSEELEPKSTIIDLSGRSSGIYFYRVIRINGALVGEGKVLIEK
jgi:Secretion system C-terminal sorting domain/Galactose oxidase, central domain